MGKEYVGIVIGRGGDTIKRLQSETGAKVQFNTIDPNAPGDRFLVIQGTKEQVAEVEGKFCLFVCLLTCLYVFFFVSCFSVYNYCFLDCVFEGF